MIKLLPSTLKTRSCRTAKFIQCLPTTQSFSSTAKDGDTSQTTSFVPEQPANNVVSEEKCEKSTKPVKIVLFGGNGYVGQGIVQAALHAGMHVVSVSRSGAPVQYKTHHHPLHQGHNAQIEWLKGDIAKPETYAPILSDATAVVSCVGAFGSNAVNGDANITAIHASKAAHVPQFLYISTVENNLPSFILQGYFSGKRRTEKVLLEEYPETGVVFRPGFIYGTREVPIGGSKTLPIPLWLAGKPLQYLFQHVPLFSFLRENVYGMQALLAPPISRDELSQAVIHTILQNNTNYKNNKNEHKEVKNIMKIEDILLLAKNKK